MADPDIEKTLANLVGITIPIVLTAGCVCPTSIWGPIANGPVGPLGLLAGIVPAKIALVALRIIDALDELTRVIAAYVQITYAITIIATFHFLAFVIETDIQITHTIAIAATLEALVHGVWSAGLHLPPIPLDIDTIIIIWTDVIGAIRTTVLSNQLAAIKVPDAPITRRTGAFAITGLAIGLVSTDTLSGLLKTEATIWAGYVGAQVLALPCLKITASIGTEISIAWSLCAIGALTIAITLELVNLIQ